jgi:hypothetical protein
MNRREQLISKTLSPSMDEKEVKMLDTTMRLILGDMGEMYAKFWEHRRTWCHVFSTRVKGTINVLYDT